MQKMNIKENYFFKVKEENAVVNNYAK